MKVENFTMKDSSRIATPQLQFGEDPNREPHEKQTALHLEGDSTHYSITSFRKVAFEKLLYHPEIEVQWVHVIDDDGREGTVESLAEVAEDPTLTIIGTAGQLPVGTLSIGSTRKSNSHAQIVKKGPW